MKNFTILTISILVLSIASFSTKLARAVPVGSAFTYQGHLYDANQLADGLYDFQFRLYDANIAGSQKGGDVNKPDIEVINGYFTVDLDFGPAVFDGNALWLQIAVRQGDLSDPNLYTILSPRQLVSPAPYALYAVSANSSKTAANADKLDNLDSSEFAAAAHSHYSLNAADGSPVNALYVNNDGNVGIGTTSPSAKFEIKGIEGKDAVMKLNAFWNPEIYFDAGGSSADIKLHFRYWQFAVINEQWQMIYDGSEKDLRFDLSGTGGILTLDQNGRVGIKTNAPNRELEVNGAVRVTALPTSSGTALQIEADGDIVKDSSSIRYKQDITNLQTDPAAILCLRPVEFKYKDTLQHDIGFIAEEVAEQIPQLVVFDRQGKPDAVKYDKVAIYLLAVIKDLKTENESLRQGNADVKKRLDEMQAVIAELQQQVKK